MIKDYKDQIKRMIDHHNADVTRLKEEHRAILDGQRAQTEQLRNEIEKL